MNGCVRAKNPPGTIRAESSDSTAPEGGGRVIIVWGAAGVNAWRGIRLCSYSSRASPTTILMSTTGVPSMASMASTSITPSCTASTFAR